MNLPRLFLALLACTSLLACDHTPPASPASESAPPPPATTASAAMDNIQNLYFSRIARFDRINNHIVAIDPHSPRVITMDPWPELVFQMADGTHTVAQLQSHMAAQYKDGPPAGLNDQIVDILKQLEKENLIRLRPGAAPLPFYLDKPVSEQNPDEARKAMERDGFIPTTAP